jgi:subtilisin family serine protease
VRSITRASLVAASAFGALAVAAAGQAGNAADTVLVCHGTSSTDNPYSLISVDVNALHGHLGGHGWRNAPDFLPDAGATSCEGGQ